jgi:hypothetical protein
MISSELTESDEFDDDSGDNLFSPVNVTHTRGNRQKKSLHISALLINVKAPNDLELATMLDNARGTNGLIGRKAKVDAEWSQTITEKLNDQGTRYTDVFAPLKIISTPELR